MSNEIFDALLREQIDLFRSAFSTVSTEVFYDKDMKKLRHAGEYGTYREVIVKDFLKFVVPRKLDMSTGFIITAMDGISTQCDVIIFDPGMTPLYQEGDRQRFFPVESVFCIGEVKSDLTRAQLTEALNKLAKVRALGEQIKSPSVPGKNYNSGFDPVNHPYDQVPSILICKKLNFDHQNLVNELDTMYETGVPHRHKHSMILSIEDGVFCYTAEDDVAIPYNVLNGTSLKHRFLAPTTNKYSHMSLFSTFMFMLTANKTQLYPEVSDYIGSISGNATYRQA